MKAVASGSEATIRRRYVWLGVVTPLLCGVLLAGVRPALAQAEKLPKAADILDKYVEATGGKAAYAKIKNRVMKGTVEMPSQGLKGSLVIYAARPNLMYSAFEIPGMVKEEGGTDGKVAWQRNSMAGARLLGGEELEQMRREAMFDKDVDWRKVFKKAETLGVEEVNGSPAYKVELAIDDENKMIAYYDQKSHLQVKVAMTVKTPMGDTLVESLLSDYRDVGGILMPHKNTSTVMMMQRVLTFDSIEVNVELPKDRFELPEDIKELVKTPKEAKTPEKKDPTP